MMDSTEITELTKGFESIRVKHEKQERAKERLVFTVEHGANVSIVVLTGPTGTGKSTILELFCVEYLQGRAAAMKADPSLRPIVYSLARASGHRAYDWRSLYRDALKDSGDAFAQARAHRKDKRTPAFLLPGESVSTGLMREQMEQSFDANKTSAWIIDEGQHILTGTRSGGPGDQFDVLKSIAQTTQSRLIVCGTPDLPDVMASSGQLARRCDIVSLNRYRWDVKAELRTLASVMSTILKKTPSHPAYPDVAKHVKFFYLGCLGCVGIFKDWVARAYALALLEGSAVIKIEHFAATRLSAKSLATINAEIIKAEENYGDDVQELDAALVKSILYSKPLPARKCAKEIGGRRTAAKTAHGSARPKSAAKPGERNPSRDAVGP